MELFEFDYGIDQSPVDNTEICTFLLYLSKEDLKEFKHQCKELMKVYWPSTYIKEGNISDLILKLIKERYEQINSKAGTNGQASGAEVQRQLFND